MANKENTGTRDLIMSNLHRTFGLGLKMSDLDCVEIASNKPVALIEWKIGLDTTHDNWQKKPFIYIADQCKIPFYCIRRNSTATVFSIEPLNEYDKIISGQNKKDKKDFYFFESNRLICNIQMLRAIICHLHRKDPKTTEIEDTIFQHGDFTGKSYETVFNEHIVKVNKIVYDTEAIDIESIFSMLTNEEDRQ